MRVTGARLINEFWIFSSNVAWRIKEYSEGVTTMARSSKQVGQRTNTSSMSGRKVRLATSTTHTGSRVEPSKVTEHGREARAKKTATRASTKAGKKKS